MAENVIIWSAKDLMTQAKLAAMVENEVNVLDDIHLQYVGNSQAKNVFDHYCATAEGSSSVSLNKTDASNQIAFFDISSTVDMNWNRFFSAADATNYNIGISLERTDLTVTTGTFIGIWVAGLTLIGDDDFKAQVLIAGETPAGGGTANMSADFTIRAYAIKRA